MAILSFVWAVPADIRAGQSDELCVEQKGARLDAAAASAASGSDGAVR
jgi:hypothetical protein